MPRTIVSESVIKEYYPKLGAAKLAEVLKCDVSTVYKAKKRYDLKHRVGRPPIITKSIIRHAVPVLGVRRTAEILGCDKSTIYKAKKRFQ